MRLQYRLYTVHAAHLKYQWDGAAIRDVFELTRPPSL